MPKRSKPIPVDTPFDEYEAMRAQRCACGGALSWGDRDSERLEPPRERYVLDRFTLTCGACGETRPIEFLCDTGSTTYGDLKASAFGVALGMGPDGAAALLAAAAGESPIAPRPRRARAAPKKKPARRTRRRGGRA
jgi:hypothetical protein